MNETFYPRVTKALNDRRGDLAPDAEAAFRTFREAVFRRGALSTDAKQLIGSPT